MAMMPSLRRKLAGHAPTTASSTDDVFVIPPPPLLVASTSAPASLIPRQDDSPPPQTRTQRTKTVPAQGPVTPHRRKSVAWVPDSLAERCYKCQAAFTLMLRRHHCRRCGNVFCDACTQARIPLVSAGFPTPVRVCDKCCDVAKKAHARLVEERQQQWIQQYEQDQQELVSRKGLSSSVGIPRPNRSDSGGRAHAPTPSPSSFPAARGVRGGPVLFHPPPFALGRAPDDALVSRTTFYDDDDDAQGLDGVDVSLRTLTGEHILLRSEHVRMRLLHRRTERTGTLYVTNYRLVFCPYTGIHAVDAVIHNPHELDVPTASDVDSEPLLAYQMIPVLTIERLKRKEMVETDSGLLEITTKDFRLVQFHFDGLVSNQTFNQFDRTVYTVRQLAYPFEHASGGGELFARVSTEQFDDVADGWQLYDAVVEFERLGIVAGNTSSRWRISPLNGRYEICATYPALLAVPSTVSDHALSVAAKFRSKGRIPVLSWRSTRTGAVICRSSQPLVGLGQRQCSKDVQLIQAIAASNPSSSKLVIIDARPWKNAVAQKTVGRAGYELTEHYETRHTAKPPSTSGFDAPSTALLASQALSPPDSELFLVDDDDSAASTVSFDERMRQIEANAAALGEDPSLVLTECKLIFMGIENIHSMRKSYSKLLDLCLQQKQSHEKWLEQLANTRWLDHLSRIIDSAVEIVRTVHTAKASVLVHCSDGWDRTAQLTGLSMLLLDPYYRTLDGFQVLIEKEWCGFGHKFRERTGHGVPHNTSSEISPVFLQWIDCVWQIQRQFPTAFEFHERFLLIILDHLYAGRFGTFLYDSERERKDHEAKHPTVSLWTYVNTLERSVLLNPFYVKPKASSIAWQRNVTLTRECVETPPGSEDPSGYQFTKTSLETPPSSNASHRIIRDLDTGLAFPQSVSRLPAPSTNYSSSTSSSNSSPRSFVPEGMENLDVWANAQDDDNESDEDEDYVLLPCTSTQSLQFWSRYYLRWQASSTRERDANVELETLHRDLLARLERAEAQVQVLQHRSTCTQDDAVDGTTSRAVQALIDRRERAMAALDAQFQEEMAQVLQNSTA